MQADPCMAVALRVYNVIHQTAQGDVFSLNRMFATLFTQTVCLVHLMSSSRAAKRPLSADDASVTDLVPQAPAGVYFRSSLRVCRCLALPGLCLCLCERFGVFFDDVVRAKARDTAASAVIALVDANVNTSAVPAEPGACSCLLVPVLCSNTFITWLSVQCRLFLRMQRRRRALPMWRRRALPMWRRLLARRRRRQCAPLLLQPSHLLHRRV
jgi:hypothetical protein